MIIEIYSVSSEQQKMFCVCDVRIKSGKKSKLIAMANHLYFSWFSFFLLLMRCHSNCFIFAFLFGDMFACVCVRMLFIFAFIFLYSSETLYLIVSVY